MWEITNFGYYFREYCRTKLKLMHIFYNYKMKILFIILIFWIKIRFIVRMIIRLMLKEIIMIIWKIININNIKKIIYNNEYFNYIYIIINYIYFIYHKNLMNMDFIFQNFH
jgi:hypothetical protein